MVTGTDYNVDNVSVDVSVQDRSKYKDVIDVRRYDIERHLSHTFTIEDPSNGPGGIYHLTDSGVREYAE